MQRQTALTFCIELVGDDIHQARHVLYAQDDMPLVAEVAIQLLRLLWRGAPRRQEAVLGDVVVAIRDGAAAGLLVGVAFGTRALLLGGGEGSGADGPAAAHAAELVDVREVELGLGGVFGGGGACAGEEARHVRVPAAVRWVGCSGMRSTGCAGWGNDTM